MAHYPTSTDPIVLPEACGCCDVTCECQACPDPIPCTLFVTFWGMENCGPIAGALADGVPYEMTNTGSGWTRTFSHDYGTHVSYLTVGLSCVSSTQVRLSFVWDTDTGGFVGEGHMTATIGGSNTCDPVNFEFPPGSYTSGAGTEPGCSGEDANFEALVTE